MNKLNSKIVSDTIKKHIMEAITIEGENPIDALKEFTRQLECNKKGIDYTVSQKVMLYTLQGTYKGFEFTNYKLCEFIKNLNLNKSYDRFYNTDNRFFDIDNTFKLYSDLMFREYNKLIKMNEKQLNKYL